MLDTVIGVMPVGYTDSNGIHTDFEVRELTGADEEVIASDKENGAKLIRTILERCCIRIGSLVRDSLVGNANEQQKKWREIIGSLYAGDADTIFLKIREVSFGKNIVVKQLCPYCKQEVFVEISLDDLKCRPFSGNLTIPFELPKGLTFGDKLYKSGTLRTLTCSDREAVLAFAENDAVFTTHIISRLVVDLDGIKLTPELARDLRFVDRQYLVKKIAENHFGPTMLFDAQCPHETCGKTFGGMLTHASLFRWENSSPIV